MSNPLNQSGLSRIEWVDGETTDFVKRMLAELNAGNRVAFLTHRGESRVVMQRIRIRVSRARKELKAKGRNLKHFNLAAHHFPYTNLEGRTFDCVILRMERTKQHEIRETLERKFNGVELSGASQTEAKPDQSAQSIQRRRDIPKW